MPPIVGFIDMDCFYVAVESLGCNWDDWGLDWKEHMVQRQWVTPWNGVMYWWVLYDVIGSALIAQITPEAAFGIIIIGIIRVTDQWTVTFCHVLPRRARDKRLHGKPCAVVQYPTGQRGRPDLRPEDDRWRTGGTACRVRPWNCIELHDYQWLSLVSWSWSLSHHPLSHTLIQHCLIHHIITLSLIVYTSFVTWFYPH